MTDIRISQSLKHGFRAIFAALLLCIALPLAVAHADPLDDARAAGLLGERPDGYVDTVKPNPPANIVELKNSINAQRRKYYQQIAGQKGVPVEEVGALAAEKTISQKLKPGMYYMNSSGQWVTK